jgi:uncharacterized membrane protein YraQ (UPF0718 family)
MVTAPAPNSPGADVTRIERRPSVLRRHTPEFLVVGFLVLVVAQGTISSWFDDMPMLSAFATVFVSIVVQAIPFLVLGVLLSAAVAAFVPEDWFSRVLPRRPAAAVPVAASAGLLLPGCECASVPLAGGLMRRGVTPAAALAFLLASPAINPIVLASTAVAFPGQPEVVAARFGASLVAAMVMGWLWVAVGKSEWIRPGRRPDTDGMPRLQVFRVSAQHDLLHAGGFLVVGGLTAAVLNTVVPPEWLDAVAERELLSILALGLLAVVLAICSEADAFVAASLTQFSPTARLTFMVVGPMVDVKLVALQTGFFGRRFSSRFAPATFGVAVVAACMFGWWLL